MKTSDDNAQDTAVALSRRSACSGLAALALSSGFAATGFATMSLSCAASARPHGAGIVEIADGVFVHTGRVELQLPSNHGDISNAGFIIGETSVAVIDTGGSYRAGGDLLAAIRQRTDKPISHVINTHMHPDHVLGNAAFKTEKPRFVAHHKMARALTARSERYLEAAAEAMGAEAFAGTQIVLPDDAVESVTQIDLGGRILTLAAQPTAHTDNDIIITDLKTGSVFAGDLIFAEHVPALDGSILGWIRVLKAIDKDAPLRVVPGHGPAQLSWAEASEPMLRYLEAVVSDVRSVIKRGGTITEAMQSAAASEKSKWALFDDFHKRNISAAFAELEWE